MGKILTLPTVASVALLATILLSGCNTTGCLQNRNSLPLAGFYSASTGKAISVTGLSVMGVGAPSDSLLYTSSETLSQIYMPLRARDNVTAYQLSFSDPADPQSGAAAVDEITFEYTATPWFASEDCGAMYRYHIDKLEYTTRVIDRVEIVDSLITNFDIETIHIFLRDNDDQEEGDDK